MASFVQMKTKLGSCEIMGGRRLLVDTGHHKRCNSFVQMQEANDRFIALVYTRIKLAQPTSATITIFRAVPLSHGRF